MYEITQCPYCGSIIQYELAEVQVGSDHIPSFMLPHIKCPECENMIVVGFAKI